MIVVYCSSVESIILARTLTPALLTRQSSCEKSKLAINELHSATRCFEETACFLAAFDEGTSLDVLLWRSTRQSSYEDTKRTSHKQTSVSGHCERTPWSQHRDDNTFHCFRTIDSKTFFNAFATSIQRHLSLPWKNGFATFVVTNASLSIKASNAGLFISRSFSSQ